MSYAKQVLCYVCSQVAQKLADTRPDAKQAAAYNITGDWTSQSWLESPGNYRSWESFSRASVLDGVAPNLVGDWLYSKGTGAGEAQTDLGGLQPIVKSPGQLSRLKSVAGYHWLLASGGSSPAALCADALFCVSRPRVRLSGFRPGVVSPGFFS